MSWNENGLWMSWNENELEMGMSWNENKECEWDFNVYSTKINEN